MGLESGLWRVWVYARVWRNVCSGGKGGGDGSQGRYSEGFCVAEVTGVTCGALLWSLLERCW